MVGVVTQAVQTRAFLEVKKFEIITIKEDEHIYILPDLGDDPTMHTPDI